MDRFTVPSADPGQTDQIAAVLAGYLAPGDVVLLKGPLATGKTAFVKAVARVLRSPSLVTSPTFTLAHFYSADAAPILHIDAYRLSSVHEFRDLGLEEYAAESITLVEWGDKVAEDFGCHLMIEFSCTGDSPTGRVLRFSASCGRWASVLGRLCGEAAGAAATAGALS